MTENPQTSALSSDSYDSEDELLGDNKNDIDSQTTEWSTEQRTILAVLLVSNFIMMNVDYIIASFVPQYI